MKIHVLGAGTPTPTPHRFGSAYVVEIGGSMVMFDCGPAATHKLVKSGLFPTQIASLFFTHHHFDHDADYPCFLLCRWDQSIGGEDQLNVYGPSPTEHLTEGIIGETGLFAHDWKARINHPVSLQVYQNRGGKLPRRPPNVAARDLEDGAIVQGPTWEVRAAMAQHVQPYLDSLAYRLDCDEGSVVITGDTEPCASVTDLARDADVMLSMCWDHQADMEAVGEARGQSGTVAAATMAAEANVGRLILVHSGANLESPTSRSKALADVAKTYSAEACFADEQDVIDVSRMPPAEDLAGEAMPGNGDITQVQPGGPSSQ